VRFLAFGMRFLVRKRTSGDKVLILEIVLFHGGLVTTLCGCSPLERAPCFQSFKWLQPVTLVIRYATKVQCRSNQCVFTNDFNNIQTYWQWMDGSNFAIDPMFIVVGTQCLRCWVLVGSIAPLNCEQLNYKITC